MLYQFFRALQRLSMLRTSDTWVGSLMAILNWCISPFGGMVHSLPFRLYIYRSTKRRQRYSTKTLNMKGHPHGTYRDSHISPLDGPCVLVQPLACLYDMRSQNRYPVLILWIWLLQGHLLRIEDQCQHTFPTI